LLFYYTAQKPIAKINITPDFNYVVWISLSQTFPLLSLFFWLCSIDVEIDTLWYDQVQIQGTDTWGTLADETKQNWSIRFTKQEDSDQFALHVALAKYHVSGAQNIVVQDLFIPSKGRVRILLQLYHLWKLSFKSTNVEIVV
jgi:hypothetical protein